MRIGKVSANYAKTTSMITFKTVINKLFPSIILIIFSHHFLPGQNIDDVKDDLNSLRIIGKAKTIKQIWYNVKDSLGTPLKARIKATKISMFDESGRLTEEKYEHGTAPNDYKTVFIYDDKGNKLKSFTYNYKKLDTISKNLYEYNGNEIIKLGYTNKSLSTKIIYKYDKKGRLTEVSTVHPSPYGSVDKYEYNRKGNILTSRKYNLDRSHLMYTYKFKYGKSGEVIALMMYETDGSLAVRKEYTYVFDKSGNWIIKTFYEKGVADCIIERNIDYY